MTKRATFSEKYRIAEALKELVTKDGDGCRYSEGNNDTSLAKTLGMPRGLVQSVRQELYGALSAEGRSAVSREAYTRRLDEFGDRLSSVEDRLRALEDAATRTPDLLDKLPSLTAVPGWKAS